jgi:hypothetical protein
MTGTGCDADFSGCHRRPDMNAHHRINGGGFQDALFNHAQCTGDLLVGLKDEFDGPCEVVPVLRQHLGRDQQHGHMGIVAAGVHHSRIFGPVIDIIFFDHRQGVHVCPEHEDRAGICSMEKGDHPGSGNPPGGQSKSG